MNRVILLVVLLLNAQAYALSFEDVRIRLHADTDLEQRGREQLQRLLRTYDLKKWLFTHDVLIQSRALPHSHPVLTLNTRYLDHDISQLATFVHEQLHWFLTDRVSEENVTATIAELKTLYPSVPSEPPEGARGADSTYLHLVVCHLELQALTELLGESIARDHLAQMDHYTWVYKTVLADTDRIRSALTRRGLTVADDTGVPDKVKGRFVDPYEPAYLGIVLRSRRLSATRKEAYLRAQQVLPA